MISGHLRLPFGENHSWTRWLPIRPGVRLSWSGWLALSIRVLDHVWYVAYDLSLFRRPPHDQAALRAKAKR
jgi:hypothetical protein